MPELPEVEVTRRQLSPALLGRTIRRVHTTCDSHFFLTKPTSLKRRLKGRTFVELSRQGKYLLADLDNGARLLLHLGMTGQLIIGKHSGARLLSSTAASAVPPENAAAFTPDRHTHLWIEFTDGGPPLYFRDVRKFGKVQFLRAGETSDRLGKLGIDALKATGAGLFKATRGRRGAIKTLLLGQSVVAGIGNIYADEALFMAGIFPGRAAGEISRAEAQTIVRQVKRVMRRSIAAGGSTISDFVSPNGAAGRYQDERKVYARKGEPCPACKTRILRIVLGGRGTHYCPRCQR